MCLPLAAISCTDYIAREKAYHKILAISLPVHPTLEVLFVCGELKSTRGDLARMSLTGKCALAIKCIDMRGKIFIV